MTALAADWFTNYVAQLESDWLAKRFRHSWVVVKKKNRLLERFKKKILSKKTESILPNFFAFRLTDWTHQEQLPYTRCSFRNLFSFRKQIKASNSFVSMKSESKIALLNHIFLAQIWIDICYGDLTPFFPHCSYLKKVITQGKSIWSNPICVEFSCSHRACVGFFSLQAS